MIQTRERFHETSIAIRQRRCTALSFRDIAAGQECTLEHTQLIGGVLPGGAVPEMGLCIRKLEVGAETVGFEFHMDDTLAQHDDTAAVALVAG